MTKVTKEIQNGQELIRVDHIYNYVPKGAIQDLHSRVQGSLWLDPARCWCIRRFKSSSESTVQDERIAETEVDLMCETIDHPSGFPILKSTTENIKIINYKNKQKSDATSKTDYDLEVNDSVPDSEFTLSAFGLPEPGGAEPGKKAMPMYVWILIAAGICGALAFAFRLMARRRNVAATT